MISRSPVRAASRPFTCHSGGLGVDDKRSAGDEGARVLDAHEPFGLTFGGLVSEAPIKLQDSSTLLEGSAPHLGPLGDGRRQASPRV